ncbi:zinc protease [Rhizomicrobium palustre]|uniref:Zinc protease n=1 Tax=Rhizomicrobium palustre TaxID=189966 RepID=A0A846N0P7_9PROT|nr:pitrilysin family protein [Rhizomicrobium palustre]NIK89069.1 zinc protease [Rhizomicrobium palustre]
MKPRTALSTLTTAVVSAVAGFAALCAATAAQAPAPSTKTFQFVLQNGLQVVVVPDHRAPVITQMVVYKVGAVDDPPGISGLAHFFEHMMFRGTRNNPGGAFSQNIARAGGDDNAFTTHDYTVFHEQIAKDKFRLVARLEADRMAGLDLSENAVMAERDVVTEERRMRIDNDPQALVLEQAEAALYLTHPYARPVIGWPEEIRRIGRQEAENFYRRHYAPNNAVLIVAGDVTPDEVRQVAEAEYGPVQPRELAARIDYAQPRRMGENRFVVTRKDAKVPLFLRLYRVQSYADAPAGAAESLELLARLMGGDATSALYRKLVVERRIATDASVSYDGYARDSGQFSISVTPRPGVPLDTIERAVDEVISNIQRRPPSKEDFARAKTQLVAGAQFRRDSQFEMASAYARALAVGLTGFDVQQWPARVQALKPAQVQAAAAEALNRNEAVTAYLLPKP